MQYTTFGLAETQDYASLNWHSARHTIRSSAVCLTLRAAIALASPICDHRAPEWIDRY